MAETIPVFINLLRYKYMLQMKSINKPSALEVITLSTDLSRLLKCQELYICWDIDFTNINSNEVFRYVQNV